LKNAYELAYSTRGKSNIRDFLQCGDERKMTNLVEMHEPW
jgi:hypothetical protein